MVPKIQPDEVSSSSNTAVTEQSSSMPPRSRINDTASIDIDRAKKRQKMTMAPSAKIDYRYSDDNVAENDAQWTVTSANNVDKDDDDDADDDDDSFDSSDNEAIIERMKLATKKNKKKCKPRSVITATDTARSIDDESSESSSDPDSRSNNNNAIQ